MIQSRFWDKVEFKGDDECWPWKAAYLKSGYGGFRMGYKKPVAASHRLAYCLVNGISPKDLTHKDVVRHTCDNRACCNPKHLVLGSHKDNTMDMIERGRLVRGAAKLSESDVLEIVDSRSRGESLTEIARRFSVDFSTIGHLCRGRSWGLVTGLTPETTKHFRSPKGQM